jgi:PAS domain S-box-containing protein
MPVENSSSPSQVPAADGRGRIFATGAMADGVRGHAWLETPLGPIAEWPEVLAWSVNLMLESCFPTLIFWGPAMIQFYNDAFLPLMGEKHPSALGQPAADCWKEAWPLIGAQVVSVLARGERVYQENVRVPVMRNGTMQDIYWTYSYSPIRTSEGEIAGVLVVCHDVTGEISNMRKLRDSEARLRRLFESDVIGVGIPTRWGGFSESNDELLRITGYTREDLAAGLMRWDVMTPPEYQATDAEHIQETALRGSCTPYEKEYIRKDGSRVPILCGYASLEGSEDEYIGFVLDLTLQKRAEEGLREREERFRLLAESLPQLVWMSDGLGENIYVNGRFSDYTGRPGNEIMGSDWRKFMHPEDVDRTIQLWQRCVEHSEPYLNEFRLRRKDGVYRHFLARAVPLLSESGKAEKWIGSCTDIHDQKLAEDALRRSEKLATAGRLAASIAHEINNPLAGVTNSLFLAMQDPALSAGTRAYLAMAEEELLRVAQITKHTLRFHKQSTSPGAFDLGEVMDSVLALFRSRLAARKITVTHEWKPGTCIEGFADELRQVFANLVSNALDATAEGGRLRIRIRKSKAWDGEMQPGVRVVVADTGQGIPEAIRGRIFEPFVTTKETTGIGLGLWVSQGIVRKHNGRIWLRTRVHPAVHGTVVLLFFPESLTKGHGTD